MNDLILHAVHLSATWAMIGLIWFVQVVHYPLFAFVGESHFVDYEQRHTVRTGWVVGPFMLAEVAAATWIALVAGSALAWFGLSLVAAIWVMTAVVQVPLHGALNRGWDEGSHRRLVLSNWGRTLLWTARGPVAVLLFASMV